MRAAAAALVAAAALHAGLRLARPPLLSAAAAAEYGAFAALAAVFAALGRAAR